MLSVNKVFASAVCASILLSSCSNSKEDYDSQDMTMESTSEAATESVAVNDGEFSDAQDVSSSSSSSANSSSTSNSTTTTSISTATDATHSLTTGSSATQTKKPLQVTMDASFVVDDVVSVVANIESLTNKYQGYVAHSQIQNNEGYPTRRVQGDVVTIITPYERYADMELRIPRRNVAKFLKEVQADIKFLQSSNFQAVDKTFDIYLQQLEVSINKSMAEELKQQRLNPSNTDSEDQSQNQSSNLDSIKATYDSKHREALAKVERMRLQDSVEYSVLNLDFSQPRDVYQTQTKNIDAVIEAAEPSFSEQLGESLQNGLDGLKRFVLWFASIWWFWILLIISVPVLKMLWRFWHKDKLLAGFNKKKTLRKYKDAEDNHNNINEE